MKNETIAAAAVGEKKDRVSINHSVKNIDQLRSVLPVMEQAVAEMGKHFTANPPEQIEFYKKNVELIGNDKNNPKFFEVVVNDISDEEAKEERSCLGFEARSMAFVKIPPFYQLLVFPNGKQLKIVSLLCTEPPCVD